MIGNVYKAVWQGVLTLSQSVDERLKGTSATLIICTSLVAFCAIRELANSTKSYLERSEGEKLILWVLKFPFIRQLRTDLEKREIGFEENPVRD